MDYKQLEEENKMLREKIEQFKNYKKNYYKDTYKQCKFYCEICDKEVSAGSKANHLKGAKHRKKILENFNNDVNRLADAYGFQMIQIENGIYENLEI